MTLQDCICWVVNNVLFRWKHSFFKSSPPAKTYELASKPAYRPVPKIVSAVSSQCRSFKGFLILWEGKNQYHLHTLGKRRSKVPAVTWYVLSFSAKYLRETAKFDESGKCSMTQSLLDFKAIFVRNMTWNHVKVALLD